MDQVKIGKLIAKLRKSKNLTQQELGNIVGVGNQAVSKWENGNCLPDISIINKLCEVLEITSDELLKGELTNNHEIPIKTNKKYRYLWLLPIILFIIAGAIILFLNKDKEPPIDANVYILERVGTDYYVSGQIASESNKLSIYINSIEFNDNKLMNTVIKNYQYELLSSDSLLYGYGFLNSLQLLNEPKTINDFLKSLKVDYKTEEIEMFEQILSNNIILRLTFLTENDEVITKDIEMIVNSLDK